MQGWDVANIVQSNQTPIDTSHETGIILKGQDPFVTCGIGSIAGQHLLHIAGNIT